MYLFFIDNSYVKVVSQDITCLGGLIIKDSEYFSLRSKLDILKASHGLEPNNPIKWSPDNDPRYVPQRNIVDQNGFKKSVLELIASANVSVILSIINTNLSELRHLKQRKKISKTDLKEFQIEYESKSIEYLAQRLQMHLQEINKRSAAGAERGLLIIEAPENFKTIRLIKHFNHVWHVGSGEFKMKFDLLSDGMVYSHDFGYDGLQFADFIVSSFTQSLTSTRYDNVRIYKEKIRKRSGNPKGAGIVIYPSNSRLVDNLISNLFY